MPPQQEHRAKGPLKQQQQQGQMVSLAWDTISRLMESMMLRVPVQALLRELAQV
jgi:hypothetical protein